MEQDKGPQSRQLTVVRETLSVPAALKLRDKAIETAHWVNIPGGVSIFNSSRWEICSQITGDDADPGTLDIARGKIRTVLNSGRSSNLQRERMREKGYERFDYMDRMGSLFGGGAAIFKDSDKQIFIGAMAFSGGSAEEDLEICNTSILDLGLFIDNKSNPDILLNRLHK